MKKNLKEYPEFLRVYGLVLLLAAAGFWLAYRFVGPAPSKDIVLATGSKSGAYYAFGQKYADIFRKSSVALTVRETQGSLENLTLLSRQENPVQAALIQGGVGSPEDFPDLESLASLYYEPLWLFHRKAITLSTLSDLKGKRIGVGSKGSGTHALASQLLADNQVADQTAELIETGGDEGAQALMEGRIDALFVVAGLKADLVRRLLATPSLSPFSFRRAEAYARNFRYLSKIVLPEGSVDLARNIPDRDIILIAPTANLVVRKDLHPALMYLFLTAASEIHRSGGVMEAPDAFPSPSAVSFPLNKEARRFFRSGPPFLFQVLPFWMATWLVRMVVLIIPLVTVLYPLLKIAPPTYNWRVRRKIFKWYKILSEIEAAAEGQREKETFEELLQQLDALKAHVTAIHVPASHMQSQYTLRWHIDLVRLKLLEAKTENP
jgi:TRAP transporter TAXI family solute receptor